MKYREARNLHNGDQVRRKSDGVILLVKNVILYGQFKQASLECVDPNNALVTVSNEEVE